MQTVQSIVKSSLFCGGVGWEVGSAKFGGRQVSLFNTDIYLLFVK